MDSAVLRVSQYIQDKIHFEIDMIEKPNDLIRIIALKAESWEMVEVREGPIWFTRTTKWTRYRGGLNGPFPSEANIDGWRNKTSLTFSLIRHNLHPVTETQSGTVGAETFNCNHM